MRAILPLWRGAPPSVVSEGGRTPPDRDLFGPTATTEIHTPTHNGVHTKPDTAHKPHLGCNIDMGVNVRIPHFFCCS